MDVCHCLFSFTRNETERLAEAKATHYIEHEVVKLIGHVEGSPMTGFTKGLTTVKFQGELFNLGGNERCIVR